MENTKENSLGSQLTQKAYSTNTGVFNPVIYQQFKVMANDMAKAGALPSGLNSQQALVIMQFGSELGIKPFTALQSIYIVNGKLTIYGSMVISRLTQDGYKVAYIDKVSDKDDENACQITVKKSDEEYVETYTFKMARLSGYTSSTKGEKFGWRAGTNRLIKLRYGAVSLLIKTHLPHLLNGAEIKEVWEDVALEPSVTVDDKGEIIDLDNENIEKINAVKTPQELIKVCQAIKKEKPELVTQILKHYNLKKDELKEVKNDNPRD